MEHLPETLLRQVTEISAPHWPLIAALLIGLIALQIVATRFRIWRRDALRQHYRSNVTSARSRKKRRS